MTPDPAQVVVAELRMAFDPASALVDDATAASVIAALDRLEAAEAKVAACCGARERVEALIEASSLGSPEAKAARESVPRGVGIAIAAAARHMRRANEAEAKVAAVEALLPGGPRSHVDLHAMGGWDLAARIRAALEQTP